MRRVPFFANQGFFPSPPEPFKLPVYAEAICRDVVTLQHRHTSRAHSIDAHVLQFVDDSAAEADLETSDSEGSSTSTHSM